MDCVILVDPERRTYQALGLQRSWRGLFHWKVLWRALTLLLQGARQGEVQGDAFQNGGVLITDATGLIVYRYASKWAGDHPPSAAFSPAG